jgi:23S rRNA pseudouridine2605 synthase
VRQLFERQGAIVSRVLRTRLGSIALDRALARGHFRELTREQIEALLLASSEGQAESAAAALPPEIREREPRQREERRSGKRPRDETGDRAGGPRDRRAASGQAAGKTAGTAARKNRRSNQSQSAGGRRSRRPPGAPVRRGRGRD